MSLCLAEKSSGCQSVLENTKADTVRQSINGLEHYKDFSVLPACFLLLIELTLHILSVSLLILSPNRRGLSLSGECRHLWPIQMCMQTLFNTKGAC